MQRKRECCAIALGSGANEGGCRNDAADMQLFVTMKKKYAQQNITLE
jgi:hypothetical protein